MSFKTPPKRFPGVFSPPEPKPPDQAPQFKAFVMHARPNTRTRRGVLLTCAKASPCRVPLYRVNDDGTVTWPGAFWELRENLRGAEPIALNQVDPYAQWTQSDILRVARALWEEFEESEFSHIADSIKRARELEEARNKARREKRAREALLEKEWRQNQPGYRPYEPHPAKKDKTVDVDLWVKVGAPKLDEPVPLKELHTTRLELATHGKEALAICNQITAGEFMRRCIGRTDLPLKGWSIYAGRALDKIPGWTRVGKKHHRGTVSPVYRRDGTTRGFTIVEDTNAEDAPAKTERRRIM